MAAIPESVSKFILERIKKHRQYLTKRAGFFAEADRRSRVKPTLVKSPNSLSNRSEDSDVFWPLTREIMESLSPAQGADLLNLTEPFLQLVPRISSEDNDDAANALENWLFYRFQTMDFINSVFLRGMTDLQRYGRVVLQTGNFSFFNMPDDILSFFPSVIARDVRSYSPDPDTSDRRAMRDEVIREKDIPLKLLQNSLDSGSPYKADFQQPAEITKLREALLSNDAVKNEEAKVNLEHWWGYLPIEGRYRIFWGVIAKARSLDCLIYLEQDPYGDNKSPFASSILESDESAPGNEVGIPHIVEIYQDAYNDAFNLRRTMLRRFARPMRMIRATALVKGAPKYREDGWVDVRGTFNEPLSNISFPLVPGDVGAARELYNLERNCVQGAQNRVGTNEYVSGQSGLYGTPESATVGGEKIVSAQLRITFAYKRAIEDCIVKVAARLLSLDAQIIKRLMKDPVKAEALRATAFRVVGPDQSVKFFQMDDTLLKAMERPWDIFAMNVDPGGKLQQAATNRIVGIAQILQPMVDGLHSQGLDLDFGELTRRMLEPIGARSGKPLVIKMAVPLAPPAAPPGATIPGGGNGGGGQIQAGAGGARG